MWTARHGYRLRIGMRDRRCPGADWQTRGDHPRTGLLEGVKNLFVEDPCTGRLTAAMFDAVIGRAVELARAD